MTIRNEARQLVLLAAPLIFGNLSGVAIQLTDAVMVAQLGTADFAAVGLAGHIGAVVFLFCSGFAHCIGVRIAQIAGACPDDTGAMSGCFWQGCWLILATSVPLSCALFGVEVIFAATGQPPDVAVKATRYMQVFAFSIPLMTLFVGLGATATALGRPLALMGVSLAAIVVNYLGNYALIFGNWGAPKLGVEGAALASIVSAGFQVGAILALFSLDRTLARLRLWRRLCRPRWDELAALFRDGLPIGLILFVEVTFFSTTAFLAGRYGTANLAGHQVAIQIVTLTLMIALGLGQATTVRVAGAYGRGDQNAARRIGFVSAGLTTILMCAIAVLLLIYAPGIAGIFADPAEPAARFATRFIAIAAVFQVADGLQTVMAAALRAMNDSRTPLALALGSYWAIGIGTVIVLALTTRLDGMGIWIGMASALTVLAIMLFVRFLLMVRRSQSTLPPLGSD